MYKISIHALLAESDYTNVYGGVYFCIISIHALLAESDRREGPHCQGLSQFLSTLSLRRATAAGAVSCYLLSYFYPRSPCGERLALDQYLNEQEVFLSTLSLRRATMTLVLACVIIVFLSTLSLRRATSSTPAVRSQFIHFYPRSPCGERLDTDRSQLFS